ncbi:MAG: DNA repair protein RadC [Gammaproteobacteria bacterium]
MTIAQWPESERPREKLLSRGPGVLSDAELLALVLHSGSRGQSSLEISRRLLTNFDGLSPTLAAEPRLLVACPGIGPARAARLIAVRELGQRLLLHQAKQRDVLSSSNATRDYLKARFGQLQNEVFSCLYLSNQHHVLQIEELFRGTIDGAAVYPREVVKRCLHHNAAAVIFAHNHPSGVAEPSQADIAITRKLCAALDTVDVRVLDHVIIGGNTAISLAERGLL